MDNLDRRSVLQTVGTVGASSLVLSNDADAKMDTGTDTEVTTINFSRLWLYFVTESDITPTGDFDPLAFYEVSDQEITFFDIYEDDIEKMQSGDNFIDFNQEMGFHEIPNVFTRKDYQHVPIAPMSKQIPIHSVRLGGIMQSPAIRVNQDGEKISFGVKNNRVELSPGEQKQVEAFSTTVKSIGNQEIELDAIVRAENHGSVSVNVKNVREGEK